MFFRALFISVFAGTIAHAKVWNEWDVLGNCSAQKTRIIENGDTLSLLFDDFGIEMEQNVLGASGLEAQKACRFRIRLHPPQGKYLAGFYQLYSGGIIKSRNSRAHLKIHYELETVGEFDPPNLIWEKGRAIGPADAESSFTREFNDTLRIKNCGKSTRYTIRIVMAAHRQDAGEFVVGGLDSLDARLEQKVKLVPAWRACP